MDRSTQTSSYLAPPQGGPPAAEAHLFSHLPLHSQQPARSPYSMVPVGGIQLVPAGLATLVPIQAGPVQLTIPAVGVIHRNASPLPPPSTSGQQEGLQVQEPISSVLPCFPLGQVGLQTQTLQPVGLETLNLMGLTNTGLLPPQGLTLNAAVGLQVLAASPTSQSGPPIPGLQIVNIALPALIPSLSPLSSLSPLLGSGDRQGSPGALGVPPPQTERGSVTPELKEGPTPQQRPAAAPRTPEPPPSSWQTAAEDNEASSDDEDRLVIAT